MVLFLALSLNFVTADVTENIVSPVLTKFDWDKYARRLEGFALNLNLDDSLEFIDYLGNKYFSTQNIKYSDDPNKIWEIALVALKSGDQQSILYMLAAIKHFKFLDRAQELLDIVSTDIRLNWAFRYIIHTISFISDHRMILPITQIARNTADTDLLTTIACALGRIKGADSELQPLLYLALEGTHINVRCAALLSIGRANLSVGREILIHKLISGNKEEKFSAIIGLTFMQASLEEDNATSTIITNLFKNSGSMYIKIVSCFYFLARYGYDKYYSDALIRIFETEDQYIMPIADFMEDLSFYQFIGPIFRRKLSVTSRTLAMYLGEVERSIRLRLGV